MISKLENIFNKQYYELVDLAENFIASHVIELFYSSGIIDHLKENGGVSSAQIIERLNFSEDSSFALERMLSFLQYKKFLCAGERSSGGIRKEYMLKDSFRVLDFVPSELIQAKMIEADAGISSFCKFSNFIFENYPVFFSGKPAAEIMFSSVGINLWVDYFSDSNSGYNKYNLFAGLIGSEHFKSGIVCELGGGCGSGAKQMLQSLLDRGALSSVERFIFTDTSPVFIRKARIGIEGLNLTARIDYRKIDFDLSLVDQGVEQNSVSFIYGINSFHAARNLNFTFCQIFRSLINGGFVLISECVHADEVVPFQEVLFCMLGNFHKVELSDVFRPSPGFMKIENWVKLLEFVGFSKIRIYSDNIVDERRTRPPTVAVIVGEK